MKSLLSTISIILFVILAILLAIGLILGWSLGLGWLLQRWIGLTLFEGAVLVMLASAGVAYLIKSLLTSTQQQLMAPRPWPPNEVELEDESGDALDDWAAPHYPIPTERFRPRSGFLTGKDLFKYEVANNISLAMAAEPKSVGMMNPQQVNEVSIRLAGIVADILKKRRNPNQTKISVKGLRQQMTQMDLRPYDQDLLELTVQTSNQLLADDEDLLEIVRFKLWDEPYE